MFETLYREEKWWSDIWPAVEDLESARSANSAAVSASLAMAKVSPFLGLVAWIQSKVGTAIYVKDGGVLLLGVIAFVFGGLLFFLCGWGLSRLSRAAAVGSLVLLLAEELLMLLVFPLGAIGGVLLGFFGPGLLRGARGTYAYHRLARQREKGANAAQSR
jgi:hypothetical protein